MAAENNQGKLPSAPNESPFFDDLPRELRNEIYRLAFIEGNNPDFKIISRVKWMDAERKSRRGLTEGGSNFARRGTSKTFPNPPLKCMHVCRQFETEAVEEWFRYHMISCPDLKKWQDLCTRDPRLQKNTVSLRCRWGSNDMYEIFRPNTGIWPGFSTLRDCDKLKNLELMVHDPIFDVWSDRIACLHDYSDADFESLEEVPILRSMNALESIVLVPANVQRSRRLAKTDVEVEKWEDNVKTLEVYLNKIIKKNTAPSPGPATDSSPVARSSPARQSLMSNNPESAGSGPVDYERIAERLTQASKSILENFRAL